MPAEPTSNRRGLIVTLVMIAYFTATGIARHYALGFVEAGLICGLATGGACLFGQWLLRRRDADRPA